MISISGGFKQSALLGGAGGAADVQGRRMEGSGLSTRSSAGFKALAEGVGADRVPKKWKLPPDWPVRSQSDSGDIPSCVGTHPECRSYLRHDQLIPPHVSTHSSPFLDLKVASAVKSEHFLMTIRSSCCDF